MNPGTDDTRTPPNFLFICTDQQRADHTGFGGNPVLETPNLDSLAAGAMVFDRAYVANPICMPNRCTIITGRMPSVHGTRVNGVALRPDTNTFLRVLNSAGYRTSHIGKAHLQNMGYRPELTAELFPPEIEDARIDPFPSGWDLRESIQRFSEGPVPPVTDFYGYERADIVSLHGDMCHGHYHWWLREQGVDPRSVQGPRNATARCADWGQVYRTALPAELHPTSYVGMRTVAEIEAAAADGRPFFIHASFPDPHHPFTPPGRYWDLYDPADIPLPESFDDPHTTSMPQIREVADHRGRPPVSVEYWAPTEHQFRHAAAAEYGAITLIDEQIGSMLEALRRTGADRDTVVIFTSDHGDMFGDHGLLLKMGIHYQGCLRVPLVIADPRRANPGRSESLVSSLDLAQTVLELAGLPEFRGMQGHSLVRLLDDPDTEVRSALMIEEDEQDDLLGVGMPLRMRTLVTPHARLTTYRGMEEGELFDLTEDPLEMHNVFAGSDTADLRCSMTEILAGEMARMADESPRPTHRA